MISMSEFVAAGGMQTLLKHAISVYVGPITSDLKQDDNYYVDIRFSFNKESPRPYLGEKDLEITADTTGALDASPTPRKIVSIMSDDGPPNSNEVEVVNGPSLSEHSGPVSESYTDDEFAARASGSRQSDTQQETVFLPDVMWIARTQALSSILKQRESVDKTDEEEAPSNAISVRAAVRAIESKEGSISSKHDDGSDIESGLIPPLAQYPPPADPSQEETDRPEPRTEPSPKQHKTDVESEQTPQDVPDDPKEPSKFDGDFFNTSTPLKERPVKEDHVADPGNDTVDKDEGMSFSVQDGNVGTDEAPPGCGLLRTSSLKAAVRTLRRSLSRDRKKAEASGAGVEQAPSKVGAGNYVDSFGDVDEIQPNDPQPTKQARLDAENPDREGSPADIAEKSNPAGDRTAKQAGSLFRRTSNLARNMLRKLSSREARAAQRGAGANEENADLNEDPSRLNRRRSLFRKRSSGEKQTNENEDPSGLNKRRSLFRKRSSGEEQTSARENAEDAPEPNRLRNRRSLIFGRRQKSERS